MAKLLPAIYLNKSSLWVAFSFGLVTIVMSSTDYSNNYVYLVKAFFIFIYTVIVGLINTTILRMVNQHYRKGTKNSVIARYLASYAFCICLIFILYPAFSWVHDLADNDMTTHGVLLISARWKDLIMLGIVINIPVMAQQNLMILNNEKLNIELESARLKTINAEAANLLLRQHIQPHFLFNALSTLKSLYNSDPESGEAYLIRLSNFLRVAVTSNSSDFMPLQAEIAHCIDYLEMQKIRFDEALQFHIDISEQALQSGYILISALQPLLENAIKHNELTTASPLIITIVQVGERVVVTNNLQPKSKPEASSGTGLSNLMERYQLLSEDLVLIKQDQHQFSVSLKIIDKCE